MKTIADKKTARLLAPRQANWPLLLLPVMNLLFLTVLRSESMEVNIARTHIFVSGRVQGVGFREFTRQTAEHFELRGWVRNLADGRVEAIAEGSSDSLRQFAAALRNGPSGARVEDLSESAEAPTAEFVDFRILRTPGPTPGGGPN